MKHDRGRQVVYDAEMRWRKRLRESSIANCLNVTKDASHLQKLAWKMVDFMGRKDLLDIKIVMSKRARKSTAYLTHDGRLGRIKYSTTFMTMGTVCHEVAHLIVDYHKFKPHGVEWRKCYVSLVREFMGAIPAAWLVTEFQKAGLSLYVKETTPSQSETEKCTV